MTWKHYQTSVSALVVSPLHLREVHHVADGSGLTHHVQAPQTSVSVAGVEGLEAVAQVALTGHLGQLTGQVLHTERERQTEVFEDLY